MGLTKDSKSTSAIQAFTPCEGKCNLTSGTIKGVLAHCAIDGDLTFNWPSGGTDTISCLAGDDLAISRGATVTIDSGTFHIS